MASAPWLLSLRSLCLPGKARGTRRRLVGRKAQAARPRLELLEERALLSAYIVSTTADSGPGSLRAGINLVNLDTSHALYASPSNPNVDEIDFDIPITDPGYQGSTGSFSIVPLSALPEITNPVVVDGGSQPGFSGTPIIELDGALAGSGANGLTISAGGSAVNGLDINQFGGYGIALTANGGNTIQGNFIGTDILGMVALGNATGIEVNSVANTIGGAAAGEGNVLSGNFGVGAFGDGIFLIFASDNVVAGNFIGTNASGTAALGNTNGILELYCSNNTIGGTAGGAGNLISGSSQIGISDQGDATDSVLIEGNKIGTNWNGTAAIPNNLGLFVQNSGGATIGGTTAAARNIISGNQLGIRIGGPSSSGTLVEGNYIGTDPSGTVAIGNSQWGVALTDGVQGCTIGGSTAAPGTGAGNLISGNGGGILISGGGDISSGNIVEGNLIGTDFTGTAALPNGTGVVLEGNAGGNLIGGATPGTGNVISGNSGSGIYFQGSPVSNNSVQGNLIGLNAGGAAILANGDQGIWIQNSYSNTIGGTTSGSGNVISGNTNNGVYILGSSATGNVVESNIIGANAAGTVALANGANGVLLSNAPGNTVGGTVSGAANLLSGNHTNGVLISGSQAAGNVILGNLIGVNAAGNGALGNRFNGIHILAGANSNTVGGASFEARNTISSNGTGGVTIEGIGTSNNLVVGNFIGTNAGGTAALGNALEGIGFINGATNNTAGGAAASARNLIDASGQGGVDIFGVGTSGNVVAGNYIGLDISGTQAIGNHGAGVVIFGSAQNNTIGGTTTSARNVISGSTAFSIFPGFGVYLTNNGLGSAPTGPVTGNLVEGNYIGTNYTGAMAVPNAIGVEIQTASNNTIGGTTTGAGNLIAYNSGAGVAVLGPSSTGDAIRANSIHDNGGLGIQLGNANNNQAFPTLTTATRSAAGAVISGTLSSSPNTTFAIDFFANSAADPSGFGEGQIYLGSASVTTDLSGAATFTTSFALAPAGQQFISATATDPIGDTSQFSQDIVLPAYLPPTASAGGPYTMTYGGSVTFNGSASQSPEGYPLTYSWTVNGVAGAASGVSPTLTWSQLQADGVAASQVYSVNVQVSDGHGPPITSPNTTLTVNQAGTTTTGSAAPSPASLGTTVTFTATVAAAAPGTGTPTGTVDFFDTTTGADLGTGALVNGVAMLSTAALPVGVNTITLSYSGDGNFLASSTTVSETIGSAIIVLDAHASGALALSGNASITENGPVAVDSDSSTALQASGNAHLTATSIHVVGGFQRSGNAAFHPAPVTGSTALADPLAGLAAPTGGTTQGTENLAGHNTATINPGIYSQINVSGNAVLTLNPGIYVIAGGGFTVSGNATVNGSGVVIFNAGASFPNPGGSFGSISISGNGLVALTAPTTGIYAGIGIFQSRDNTRTMTLGGNAEFGPDGTVYLPSAALNMSGNSNLSAPLIVNQLSLSGNADPSPMLPPRPEAEPVTTSLALTQTTLLFPLPGLGSSLPSGPATLEVGGSGAGLAPSAARLDADFALALEQPALARVAEDVVHALESATLGADELPAVDAVFASLLESA